ncbi:nucleotide disphospho-sugar-binding domain-containing protein [Rhodococcus qingshengii]|uniref:nucleotide disphospho-sugar-binding domain-containing protein n=1 Tax=Rhodococcus qingshengii TaxID=334542 RepID=UPI0036DDFF89
MRVLFVSYAEKTHFLPMVPLAWALRAAGHDVRVASQPELTDVITRAGLTAVPVGRDHLLWQMVGRILTPRVAAAAPELYQRTRAGQSPPFDLPTDPCEITNDYLQRADIETAGVARIVNETMIDDLVAYARYWRPNLVVWEPSTHAGAIAAEAVGAAHARFLWGPDHYSVVREHVLTRLEKAAPGGLTDWLTGAAQRFGVQFDERLVIGGVTLDQQPPVLRFRGTGRYLAVRHVPYGGVASVPNWLQRAPQRPRIALTLGVSATERFDGYRVSVADLLNALGGVDAEIVATVSGVDPNALPPNVRVVGFAPLHALLSSCSAVIHHGGAGTVACSGLLGLPQMIIPDQGDGEFVAARLAAHGSALTATPSATTGTVVAEAARRLLAEPAVSERAADLRSEVLRMPTPTSVVAELEALVASVRS